MENMLCRQPFILNIKNVSNLPKKVIVFDPDFNDNEIEIAFLSGGENFSYRDFLYELKNNEILIGRCVIRSISGYKRVYNDIYLDCFGIYYTTFSKKIKFSKTSVLVNNNTKQNSDLFVASFNTRLTFNKFPPKSVIELLVFPLAVPKNTYN